MIATACIAVDIQNSHLLSQTRSVQLRQAFEFAAFTSNMNGSARFLASCEANGWEEGQGSVVAGNPAITRCPRRRKLWYKLCCFTVSVQSCLRAKPPGRQRSKPKHSERDSYHSSTLVASRATTPEEEKMMASDQLLRRLALNHQHSSSRSYCLHCQQGWSDLWFEF